MPNPPLHPPRHSRESMLLSFHALFSYIQNNASFTAEEIVSLGLWNENGTKTYLALLRKNKLIHISGWIPPLSRGNPSRIYSTGNKQDIKYIPVTDQRRISRDRQTNLVAISRTASHGSSWFPS